MSELLTQREGAILILTFNRPSKKNALTADMYAAAAQALNCAVNDPSVRVALIRGEGGAFCAGNDLADFANAPPADEKAPVFRFMREIANFEKPLVAAVQGVAVGVGTTMLLHCDLVYAARDARFSLPFVNLAVVPEAASSYLLTRLAGWQRAAELLMLGEPFGVEEAKQLGFVNAVVENENLLPTALATAKKLAAKPPKALMATKALMRKPLLEAMQRAMRDEARVFGERLKSPEAKEAFAAFFEKRPADFSRF